MVQATQIQMDNTNIKWSYEENATMWTVSIEEQ